jgi:hypothetical protein
VAALGTGWSARWAPAAWGLVYKAIDTRLDRAVAIHGH